MSEESERTRVEAQVRSCYATWARTYFDDYYAGSGAYPPVHVDIVRALLKEKGARTLLDAGCGPASMLRRLADLGLEVYGFDVTAEMVVEARRVMAEWRVPPERFWEGSVAEAADYRRSPAGYDALVCFGVLPHVPESLDEAVIANQHAALAPGGIAVLEARNQLFALFTLNRYTHELFLNDLIEIKDLSMNEREALAPALAALEKQLRVDLPPVRAGYDEVLSRTHNPFLVRAQFERAGFRDVRLHFYHYHALPPMLESHAPEWFRRRSLALEDPSDWRGYFMASAFVVSGIKG